MDFTHKLKLILRDKNLRNRIFFVLGALVVFRLLASIPIPGVNLERLNDFFSNNQFLGLLNIFSGGGLSNLSIVMLGVSPFITASIIMQLATMMFPKLKQLYHEEGEAGRKKFSQYSRLLTIPLAFIQGFGFLKILQGQEIVNIMGNFELFTNIAVIMAGSIFLVWIGELISEYGIGNGVSLLIFAGIVAGLPTALSQLYIGFEVTQIPLLLGFLAVAGVIILGIVIVTEAERPIPINYAKRVRGSKVYGGISTYLPLRVNQAGVIPIIFAMSIMLFPQMILNFFVGTTNEILKTIVDFTLGILENGWFYAIFYFILVFLFTYFYTAVTFDPEAIATNLKKSGAFIPGIRPGQSTSEYLGKVLTRITLVGALFLGVVAVLPLVMKVITGIATLAIGGTALLIVVSVVLDLIKKIDAQISMREY